MNQLDGYRHMIGELGITFGNMEESIDPKNDIIYYDSTKWEAKKLREWIKLFDLKITKEIVCKGWLYEKGRIEVEGTPSSIRMMYLMIDKMKGES